VASGGAIYNQGARGRPGDRRLREWRIRQLARRGFWDRAAVVAGELSDTQAYDRINRTCLLIMAGDRDGYRRLCRETLEPGERSEDPATLVLANRPGILAPDSLYDRDLPIQMAERALKRGFTDQVHWPGCMRYVLGAAHYRAGHYDQAVHFCRQSLEKYPNWQGKVLNWPVLALAYQRLGHAEEARKALAQAWSMAGASRRGGFETDRLLESDYGGIANWLELMVWLREAETVILDDPVFPADPFAPDSSGESSPP
jgi:tetratricopeptide (TPR) repeat protein